MTKAISTQEYYQAYAHLLLANVHAPRFRPVVVVTDLIDDWTIHWLDRRRICTFACPDRGTALAIIDCLIAGACANQVHLVVRARVLGILAILGMHGYTLLTFSAVVLQIPVTQTVCWHKTCQSSSGVP